MDGPVIDPSLMRPDESCEDYIARRMEEDPQTADECERLAYRVIYGEETGEKLFREHKEAR